MNTWLLGAANAAAEPIIDTPTALLLILTGLVGFLAKALVDLRREVETLRRGLARQPASASSAPLALPAIPAGLAPELEAAICAAVYVSLQGAPARIVRISAPAVAATWSLEGRREVFESHRVR